LTARFALVGTMGPPGSQVISTIGETVNVCARLESLTKEYDCAVVVSRRAAEMAGLAVKGRRLHQVTVNQTQTVEFYALRRWPMYGCKTVPVKTVRCPGVS
jgi:class 3 adenylate cyclase